MMNLAHGLYFIPCVLSKWMTADIPLFPGPMIFLLEKNVTGILSEIRLEVCNLGIDIQNISMIL